ncbi:MAG: sialate O-acetylesterase [Phycisphaerae bacterium]|nr:sialate O-acetylesterase [Phycisphaerae bacterium]
MNTSVRLLTGILAASLASAASGGFSEYEVDGAGTFKVFLLAGQSNMEGHAVVDLDHPDHYNGGRGNLERTLDSDSDLARRFAGLRDEDGDWTVRDDVWCWYRPGKGPLKAGPLSIGFAVYEGRHHFGPELGIGRVLGDDIDAPVLLVKTAWGGKSLQVDFRPPSLDGETGPFYRRMLKEYQEGVADARRRFPQLEGLEPELAGFFWFQGWNDMVDREATEAYPDNLEALAADVRDALGSPDLPIVVGETGNAGHETFRRKQAEGTSRIPPPSAFVETRAFLRKPEDSPNQGHGHHWFGNAESYALVGEALGVAMRDLLRGSPDREGLENRPES